VCTTGRNFLITVCDMHVYMDLTEISFARASVPCACRVAHDICQTFYELF